MSNTILKDIALTEEVAKELANRYYPPKYINDFSNTGNPFDVNASSRDGALSVLRHLIRNHVGKEGSEPRVFSEEEVKAMLNDLHRSRADKWMDDGEGGLELHEMISPEDLIFIARKHGIDL